MMEEVLDLYHLLRRQIRVRGRAELRLSHCLGRSFGCVGPAVGSMAGAVLEIGLVVIGLELGLGPGPGPGPVPDFGAVPDQMGLDAHWCSLLAPVHLAVEFAVAPFGLADVELG